MGNDKGGGGTIQRAEMTPHRVLAHGRSLHKITAEGVMRFNVGPVCGKSAKVSERACPSNDSPFGPPM